MSLITAITQDDVLANLVVEGGVDAAVFEHFVHELLKHLRAKKRNNGRPIVLFMDNAAIHHHESIVRLADHYRVFILYTAQYSPWLNPVEAYFWTIKQQLAKRDTA
jgi:transposase